MRLTWGFLVDNDTQGKLQFSLFRAVEKVSHILPNLAIKSLSSLMDSVKSAKNRIGVFQKYRNN